MEILAFAIFMMFVGRIGTVPLAASGIAFNLNMIVFMPMLGLGIGVAALVGRYLGAEQPEVAERAVYSAFAMSLAYMLVCGLLYVGASGPLLAPYAAGAPPGSFDEVAGIATVLLRFIALYSIFDMMNLVFAAGLKGSGDTLYPLGLTFVLSWLLLLGPSYYLCVVGVRGLHRVVDGHGLRDRPGPPHVPSLPRRPLEGPARHRTPRARPRPGRAGAGLTDR